MNGRFVEITSDAVNATGHEISDLAEETRNLVNGIRSDIDNMSSYWSGTDEAEYVKMALENTDKTNKLLESFAGAGAGITTSAENYQRQSDEYQSGIRNNHYDV